MDRMGGVTLTATSRLGGGRVRNSTKGMWGNSNIIRGEGMSVNVNVEVARGSNQNASHAWREKRKPIGYDS